MVHLFANLLFALSVSSWISVASSRETRAKSYLRRADQQQNATSSNDNSSTSAGTFPTMVVAIKTDASQADIQQFQTTMETEFGNSLRCAKNSTGFPMYCRAVMRPDQVQDVAKSTNVYSAIFPDMTLAAQYEIIWEDDPKTTTATAATNASVSASQSTDAAMTTDSTTLSQSSTSDASESTTIPDVSRMRRSAKIHKRALEVQPGSPVALQMVSQKGEGSDGLADYLFDSSAGKDVTVYYISLNDASDCAASKISSRNYGVAKLANVTAVKVSNWNTPIGDNISESGDDSDNGEDQNGSENSDSSGATGDGTDTDADSSSDSDSKGEGDADDDDTSSDDSADDDSPDNDDADDSASNSDENEESDGSEDDSSEGTDSLESSANTRRSVSQDSTLAFSDLGYVLSVIVADIAAQYKQGKAVVLLPLAVHIDANSYTALDWLRARLLDIAALDVPIVVGAGDGGASLPVDSYPALFAPDIPNMIVVGAANTRSGQPAAFSQPGNAVHVFAPGTAVQCAASDAADMPVRQAAGTSVAAAQVAGLAAYFMALPGTNIPAPGAGGRALWARAAIEQVAHERTAGGPKIIYNGL